MKILLLELSCADSTSRSPSKYGGAGITMRRIAENIDNCYIAAEESTFEGDITNKCIPVSKQIIEYIRGSHEYSFTYHNLNKFDIYVYCNPSIILQIDKPQICWALGQNEKINLKIENLLLHNSRWQQPIIQNLCTKIYEFTLGIDIPEFKQYEKEDFGFQCSNHYYQINSAIIANWCRKHGIKWLFAGPISQDYKKVFLNEIDYKNTFYLGQIDESEKIKLLKRARCYSNCVGIHQNGPQLGVKQAWSYCCPIVSTNMGIMTEVIQNGQNGFLISNEEEFILAWQQSQKIDQKTCWNTAQNWSMDKMVESFKNVINEVTK